MLLLSMIDACIVGMSLDQCWDFYYVTYHDITLPVNEELGR